VDSNLSRLAMKWRPLMFVSAIFIGGILVFVAVQATVEQPAGHDEGSPAVRTAVTTIDGQKWTIYIGESDGFRLSLPNRWQHRFDPGEDPDDEYDIVFGSDLSGSPLTNPSTAKGSLALGEAMIGHGTPGPLRSRRPAEVDGQPATRLVWESATLRLLQYRWEWKGKAYLLEVESGIAEPAVFATLERIVQQVRLV
jgi:hypothetical protein